jgi:hypothetical protein
MLESRESQTVLDDERSNEIGNEGGASGLVFFGMQVELAFGEQELRYVCQKNWWPKLHTMIMFIQPTRINLKGV